MDKSAYVMNLCPFLPFRVIQLEKLLVKLGWWYLPYFNHPAFLQDRIIVGSKARYRHTITVGPQLSHNFPVVKVGDCVYRT